ncbi:MAG: AAA family ATPase [Vallitalea sp.]|jgi:cellulose biosynthesis protein BcsQ|nr:AAA family ATPase [Vallitalea sp.]
MVKFNVLIADCDKGYTNAISQYLSTWEETDYNIISFTEKQLLQEYLKTEKTDILLISPELLTENINLSNVQVTIINTPDRIPESLLSYPYINKYQPGDKIARELINIFSKYCRDEIVINNNNINSTIIGVYSPIGGIGKTTVAVEIGKQYALNGYKTLFISLEELSSYISLLDCDFSNNFSDLLYHLKQKNKNLIMKIEGLKNVDKYSGMNYFCPVSCYMDIQEISINEWIELLEYIRNNSDYEKIILDFNSSVNEKNIKILKECDKVIMLINNDKMAQIKINQLYKNLDILGIEDLSNNVDILFNNINDKNEILEDKCIIGKKINYYIPYDENLNININAKTTLNLKGSFSNAIKDYIKDG